MPVLLILSLTFVVKILFCQYTIELDQEQVRNNVSFILQALTLMQWVSAQIQKSPGSKQPQFLIRQQPMKPKFTNMFASKEMSIGDIYH